MDHALRSGYRHIDAAACYLNETEVGSGWTKSGVPREQIYVGILCIPLERDQVSD